MSRPDYRGDPVLAEEDRLDRMESRDPRPVRVLSFDRIESAAMASVPDAIAEGFAETSPAWAAEVRRRKGGGRS